CAGLDAAAEAVPHHEVGSGAEGLDERPELTEVVAVVGVGHHDELGSGGGDPSDERASVSLNGDVDDARAELTSHLPRTVSAAIVRDDDFALESELLH